MCINENLFPLTLSLSISTPYSTAESLLPLSHSPKFPNPNPKLKPEFHFTKFHSFSILSPFLGSGRILARGGGRRACAVVAPAAASGGCSLWQQLPAAAAAAAAACCCSLLLLPARRGSDGERHTQRGKAGFDDLKRGEALGEGVAFISDFSSISNFNPLIIILVLFMKFLLIVWGESSFDLSIGNGLIVWI